MSESLKTRALRLLSQREHSRAELTRKLAPHGTPEEIVALLERLEDVDLQSDARFAESYVRSRQARYGSRRIALDLKQRGVSDDLIAAALDEGSEGDDQARARDVWAKKFGTPPVDAREWARQARFLQGRGFGADVIHRILKDRDDEPA
ncbi:MAG TPA: recombination regulator RecX [Denitromonas sp.]|uniref:recombination regulator RecX n=1 Tax=Denitromonas sp. TaxID=2734609 RepID=UPI001D719BCF|nr:recombination regulator RecX [Rhodocyclaceae bacterium]MCP5222381.1 recombination regulator RecX [Zoogloeaceae bacterium]HPR06131.1 recombination regulator RecX [Denitromonas sp.]HQU89596.1 recombination regulator RecX [Denitromonas sp.]HQV14329.1 recombination regulator RecX [Denitromonas sp.]